MDNSIHIPLDLPDVRVLEVSKTEEGHWLIRIESTLKGTTCRRCGQQITHFHGFDYPIRLRHLPLFNTPVWIEFRPKPYQCHKCNGKPTTTQRLNWHDLRSPNTKPYEKWLLCLLINSTVADVARKLKISDEIVSGVLERWVTTEVNWEELESIEVVGIDEIALKRGHRDYVVLITTPLRPKGVEVLAVLTDRKKETIAKFFAFIPPRLQQTIKTVCTDMYQGFVNAVQEQLPGVKIVIDRYHVAQAYRDCADKVRKQELKVLKRELSKEEYEQIKGAMWPFRKSPENLKDCAIRAWCKRVRKSEIKEFESFLGTVETWLDKITNYFWERLNSGFVEGFNNRVKVLKRRCYGIFDVGQIFQRLTLDINGYERFGFT